MLGYVKLAVEEGGEIVCGEGKDAPLKLSSPHTEVHVYNSTLCPDLDFRWRLSKAYEEK